MIVNTKGIRVVLFFFILAAASLICGSRAWAHEESVLFTKDGSSLIISRESVIEIWDWRKGEKRETLTGHSGRVQTIALSPDGSLMASAAENVIVRESSSWKEKRRFKGEETSGLAFGPDGRSLAVSSLQGTVTVWDLGTGKKIRTLNHPRPVTTVAWSPDGRYLASAEYADDNLGPADHDSIALWEGSSNVLITRTNGNRFWVNHIAFSPDGRALASAGYQCSAFIWDIPSALPVARLGCGLDALRALDFSRDGRLIAAGGESDRLSLWSRDSSTYSSWRLLWSIDTGSWIGSVALSPDGSVVAVGPRGFIIDAATGKMRPPLCAEQPKEEDPGEKK